MLSTTIGGIAVDCRCKSAFHLSAILLLACCALALSASPSVSAAQAPQDSKHASAPTAPSAGKALIIIYRKGGFVGSASHDALGVNGVLLATLLNGEYASTEVQPGTVVVSGLPKMYYGGIIQSTGAAVNETTRKENERARFEVEAGKTYYLKWTAGAMGTGIKVTPVDEATGAREVSKLHPSKPVPVDAKAGDKQEVK